MEPLTIDLEPLRSRVGGGDIRWFGRMAGIPLTRRFEFVVVVVPLLALVLAAGLAIAPRVGIVLPAPIVLILVGYAVLGAVLLAWYAVTLPRRVRIAKFAVVNGFDYVEQLDLTRRPGSAFARTVRSRERELVISDRPELPFMLGRHYSIPDAERRAAVQRPFVFLELALPRSVPQLVLKNRRSSVIPTLGLGRGAAAMRLEGDFASTFTVFAPKDYERDALYIFTPNVMAKVLDLAGDGELELVDDRLYVYLQHGLRLDRPETMRRIIELADELRHRFERQTRRYTDDAVDDASREAGARVGLAGRRLRSRGVSVVGVAFTTAIVVLSAAVTVGTLFGGDLLRSLGVGP